MTCACARNRRRQSSERAKGLSRSLRVLQALVTRPYTLDQLAGDEGVTTRTIRRDIAALEAAGFPIAVNYDDAPAHTGYWSCRPTPLARKLFLAAPAVVVMDPQDQGAAR